MTTVLVTGQVSPQNMELMRQSAPTVDLRFAPRLTEGDDGLADIEAIAGTIKASHLAQASRLKWVHSWAAGADNDLFPEMVQSSVVLTSSAGNGAIPLAEHSMLLMLMLNRDVPRWMRAQVDRKWERFTHPELNGLTVGIFGLGNSGSDLALKAKAFHMRVLGLRRNADRAVPGVDRMFTPDQLHASWRSPTSSS